MECQYIFIKMSNLKSEMILALIPKILSQSVWKFCMKKEEHFIKWNGKTELFGNFLKKSF